MSSGFYESAWDSDGWCEAECPGCGLIVTVDGMMSEEDAVSCMHKLWNGKRIDS